MERGYGITRAYRVVNEDVAIEFSVQRLFSSREVRVLGRCSVRVSFCVSLLAVDKECIRGIVRACGGVNDNVAIEYSCNSFSQRFFLIFFRFRSITLAAVVKRINSFPSNTPTSNLQNFILERNRFSRSISQKTVLDCDDESPLCFVAYSTEYTPPTLPTHRTELISPHRFLNDSHRCDSSL